MFLAVEGSEFLEWFIPYLYAAYESSGVLDILDYQIDSNIDILDKSNFLTTSLEKLNDNSTGFYRVVVLAAMFRIVANLFKQGFYLKLILEEVYRNR